MLKNDAFYVSCPSSAIIKLCVCKICPLLEKANPCFTILSLNLSEKSTYQGALDDHLLGQDVSREPGNRLSPPSPGNQGWCANDRVLELPILGRMGDTSYYILHIIVFMLQIIIDEILYTIKLSFIRLESDHQQVTSQYLSIKISIEPTWMFEELH